MFLGKNSNFIQLPITGCLLAIEYSLLHNSVSSNIHSSLQTLLKLFVSLFLIFLNFFLVSFVTNLKSSMWVCWNWFTTLWSRHNGNAEKHILGWANLLQLVDMSLKNKLYKNITIEHIK